MTSLMRTAAIIASAAALIAACDSSVDTTPTSTGGGGKTGSTTSSASNSTSSNTGGAGGSSTSSSGTGGSANWETCFGKDGKHVQGVLNICDQNTVCAMVEHQIDCCGNVMLVGIDSAQQATFEACEAAWSATLPECDCPVGPPQIQQPYGQTVDSAANAMVDCLNWTMSNGVCITVPK